MGSATYFQCEDASLGSHGMIWNALKRTANNGDGYPVALSKEGAQILVAVSTALAIVAPPAMATSLIPGRAQDGAIFYTAAITVVGAFFLLNAALRNRVGLYYAALFAVMLAVVWIVEGGLSRWSGELGEEPARALGLTIGLAAAALGFHVAERAFEPGRGMPLARYGLRGLALLSVILVFGAWYWPHLQRLISKRRHSYNCRSMRHLRGSSEP